jgi:hypothetical protein
MMNKKEKYNFNRKVFIKSVFNMVRNSEFMESVVIELLKDYEKNNDEQNLIEYDSCVLKPLLEKAIELEWYELCARIHKQLNNEKK